MQYMGERLRDYLKGVRGGYTDLADRMTKYRKPRANSGDTKYYLAPLMVNGHNITISILTALMRETGLPIDFFIDFEPGELPAQQASGIVGDNNIVNSNLSSDLTLKIDHLNEVIRLKDQLIQDKERIIALKDAELEQWKKRYDDLIRLTQCGGSDKNGTK